MEAELGHCFNPASSHALGRKAHRCLELARAEIAELLGCDRTCIYFTGGGTQSDNLAILGFVRAHAGRSPRVFVSEIEHKACLESAERMAGQARLGKVPVAGCGTVDLDWLDAALGEDPGAPTLVSIMWANNEVGTIQPMSEIVEIARRHGALVHTDAVQALGKVPVRIDDVPVDMLTATAHKLGGPVGIGLLYCKSGVELEPLSFGGGQEQSMWPGTQNPLGATGFATAVRLAIEEQEPEARRWTALRERFERRLKEEVPRLRIHAEDAAARLPHIVSVGIEECDPGAVLVSLDLEGFAVSGGPACDSGSGTGSTVLAAMGLGSDPPYATVRFSFGRETTGEGLDRAVEALARIAERVLALGVS